MAAGQQAEQGGEQHHHGDPVQQVCAGEPIEQIQDQIQDHQADVQLIVAVPAIHKALDRVSNHVGASSRGGKTGQTSHPAFSDSYL